MNKKFVNLNILLILLIILVFIFDDYFSPIESRFQHWWSLKNIEWKILLLIFSASIIFSAVISFQRIKQLNFKSKFLRIFAILNSLTLIFLIFQSGKYYIETKNELNKRESELIRKAKSDIKKDQIIYEFAGGFEIPMYSQKNQNIIDSINKSYGIKYVNTGCTIDLLENQAQEKYTETVKPYLDKRNGKNWEEKRKFEISKIKRDFR